MFIIMNDTQIKKINDIIVSIYFEYLIKDVKYMKKKGYNKDIDYFLETTTPNICKDDELDSLLLYIKEFKNEYPYFSEKDITISILLAYYNLNVLEYDDIIVYSKLLKISDCLDNVFKIYMGIIGITYSIGHKEVNCCYKPTYKVTYSDYNNDLNQKLRRYILFGSEQTICI